MDKRWYLVAVSASQLAAGVAGQVLALRDRRAFDLTVLGWRGDAARVARDSWLLGTGISAPVTMLATQAVATAALARRPGLAASRTLGILRVAMVPGYVLERAVQDALLRRTAPREVRATVAAGLALSVAMAVLGLPAWRRHARPAATGR